MEEFIVKEITGMLAIGNGEECPFCDLVIEENTDTLKHMIGCHQEKLNDVLFGGEDSGTV